MNWLTCFGAGTRRNKTGTKKSSGRDDASEEGGSPSTPPTPASRTGTGVLSTTIGGGGGSSSTLSSLNSTKAGGAGPASSTSALPVLRTSSETRKFTSEAAKRLSAGGSRKSATDEGALKMKSNDTAKKTAASYVGAASKKTVAEHSRRTALEGTAGDGGMGGGGASKRLRSASNSSARGGAKRLSGAGLQNLTNPQTSRSPSCGARTSGSFTSPATTGSPRQSTFTLTPGTRASARLSSSFNKDNKSFTNNRDQSTAFGGGKTTEGLIGKLGGGSNKIGGSGGAVKTSGVAGTGASQRTGGRTATVTPSEVAFGKRTPKSLTRFGFIDNSPSMRSGDSTDSVNSILSDVLASSESNSNILDYYEEHSGNVGAEEVVQEAVGEESLSKRITKNNNLKNNLLLCQPSRTEGQASIRSASSSRCDDVIVHSCNSPKSPTSISQASSGVTSAATTARLKAHTRQLPQPQLPAVRSFSTSSSALNDRKTSSSSAETVTRGRVGAPFGQRKRPVSMTSPDTNTDVSCFQPHGSSHKLTANLTACPVTFKAVTNGAANKSFSATPSPVEDKDSESPKSINTLDSGLGSSMEGDKLKTATNDKHFRSGDASAVVKEKNQKTLPQSAGFSCMEGRLQVTDIKRNYLINSGPVDTITESDVISSPSVRGDDTSLKTSIIDESDKWLREKKNRMGKASKLQTGTFLKPAALSFTNVLKVVATSNQPTTSVDPVTSNEPLSGNEPYTTYGVARQKFAVSDRNRFGFHAKTDTSLSSTIKLDCANKLKLNKSPSDPGKRLAASNSTAANASKLTRVNSNPNSIKSTTFRPTSLIKTPILVTPVSNETVEISKPIFKKLEYTEGSSSSGRESVDSASVDRVRSHRKNSAEDLLMVSSLEVQVSTDEGGITSNTTSATSLNDPSSPTISSPKSRREMAFNKKLNHKTANTSSYNVLESPSAPESMLVVSKLDGFSLVSPSVLSNDETKLMSPESESSFEVLDSPSEGLDYTDSSACNTVLYQDPAYRDILAGQEDLTSGNAPGYLQQYDVELIGDEIALEKPKLMESPLHKAQQPRNYRQDSESFSNIPQTRDGLSIQEDVKVSGCGDPHVDRLTSSLEKSSLVESLTNAVLTESLELSMTASRSSENSVGATVFSTDPSAFYSIAATTSSGSADLQRQLGQGTAGGVPSSGGNEERLTLDNTSREGSVGSDNLSKTEAIEKFMNNLNNSKLEIVDILNNFTVKPDAMVNTGFDNSHTNDVNQNMTVPLPSGTFDANLNLSSIERDPNQTTTLDTTSTVTTANSTAIDDSLVNCQEVPTSVPSDPVPDPSGGGNSTSIMMMSTSSSVFSEANSSSPGRFTPSSLITRCNSGGATGGGGGLQPNNSSSGGGGTGSSVTGGPADMDQDFLIDDEISDQPDLTFYGDDMCSSAAGGLDQSDLGPFGDVDDYLNNYQLPPPQQQYQQEAKKMAADVASGGDSSILDEVAPGERYYPGDAEEEPESVEAAYDAEGVGQQRHEELERRGDGESLVCSDDEGIFADDLQQPSPCHAVRRVGVEVVAGASSTPSSAAGLLPLCLEDLRTAGRPDSVCTLASSLDPDDFMLDFEVDDFSSQRCATPPGSLGSVGCGSNSLRSTGNNSRHCSPHLGPGSANGSGLKRPLGSLTRTDGSKPTRLPVLRQQFEGEQPPGSPVPALDKALQQQLLQDCHATKTMLLQLRNLLLHADTATPFALSNKAGDEACVDGSEASDDVLGADQTAIATDSVPRLVQQNTDLRKQVILLQQQLEERDRAMRNLQQRLHVTNTSSHPSSSTPPLHITSSGSAPSSAASKLMSRSLGSDSVPDTTKNAATQTDRSGRPLTSSSLTRPPSVDDGLGPTVSSEDASRPPSAPCTNSSRRPPSRLPSPSPCLDSAALTGSETRSGRRSASLSSPADDSSRLPQTDGMVSADGEASVLRSSPEDSINTHLCNNSSSAISNGGGYSSSSRCRNLSGDSIQSSNSSVDSEPVLTNGHHATDGCSPNLRAFNGKANHNTNRHNTANNGRFARRQSPSQDITCKTFQERKEIFSAVSTARNLSTRGLAARQPS